MWPARFWPHRWKNRERRLCQSWIAWVYVQAAHDVCARRFVLVYWSGMFHVEQWGMRGLAPARAGIAVRR